MTCSVLTVENTIPRVQVCSLSPSKFPSKWMQKAPQIHLRIRRTWRHHSIHWLSIRCEPTRALVDFVLGALGASSTNRAKSPGHNSRCSYNISIIASQANPNVTFLTSNSQKFHLCFPLFFFPPKFVDLNTSLKQYIKKKKKKKEKKNATVILTLAFTGILMSSIFFFCLTPH